VHIVQCCLYLIEHIERARSGIEDGEQEGKGGQTPFATGQKGHQTHLLAHGLSIDGNARLGVVRIDKTDTPPTSGEENREVLLKCRRYLGEGTLEPIIDLPIECRDHLLQLSP